MTTRKTGGRRHGLTPSGESPQRRYRTSPEAEDDLDALCEAWGDWNRSRVIRRALRVARETTASAPAGKRRKREG